jgi:hypothetical protein
MGITAGPTFTTDSGFILNEIYLSVNFFRMLTCPDGNIQCAFGVTAYMSRADKQAGRSPIPLNTTLSTIETFLTPIDFLRNSLHGVAYNAIKARWNSYGYTVTDVNEPGQEPSTFYTYNSSGFNVDGYNAEGFNESGFNAAGFGTDGYNTEGYDKYGFDRQGYNSSGFNENGYNAGGYDTTGFNKDGWDKDVFGRDGYNMEGLDREGNPRPSVNPLNEPVYLS